MKLATIEYIGAKPRKKKRHNPFLSLLLFVFISATAYFFIANFGTTTLLAKQSQVQKRFSAESLIASSFDDNSVQDQFTAAALLRTKNNVTYDPAYYNIDYPMGDVPAEKGISTDVIIRTYRELDIDLQQLIHEDMGENFYSYPRNWELKRRDHNIDHRRVPNLRNFFARNGESLTISQDASNYQKGDIVTWQLSHGAPHIGIVVPSPIEGDDTPWIVHNIGSGPQWENSLFSYKITGHYRYGLN